MQIDEEGKIYVLMGSGERGVDMKAYIPSDEYLSNYDLTHYRGR